MKHWPAKRVVLYITGLVLGAAGGYAYWYYVGCYSGTCPITSNAANSTLYGLVMGGLLAASVWDVWKKEKLKPSK